MPCLVGRAGTVLSLVVLAACSDPTEPESLREARQKWDELNFSLYEYVGTRTAFVGSSGPVTVTVHNNQVVSVVDANGAEVSTFGWPTIDGLFDQAAQAIARDELNQIEFDEGMGYPTLVDTGDWTLDGGVRHTISSVRSIGYTF